MHNQRYIKNAHKKNALSLFPFLKVCKTFIRREQLVNTKYADFRTQKLYLYIYRKKKKKRHWFQIKGGRKKRKEKLTVIETPPNPRWLLITTFQPCFAVLKARCFKYCNRYCKARSNNIKQSSYKQTPLTWWKLEIKRIPSIFKDKIDLIPNYWQEEKH